MRVVHLRLVTGRPLGSKLRAEIHAGIAAMVDLDFGFELAVLALVQHVEQMAALAIAHDLAVLHGPALGIVTRFPAIHRFTLEHGDPSAAFSRPRRRRPPPRTHRARPTTGPPPTDRLPTAAFRISATSCVRPTFRGRFAT